MVRLTYAVRQFRRSPVFTLTAVLTLALGIGGTTAIFSLMHDVMLRSLPVSDPGSLYRIGSGNDCCVEGGPQDNWGLYSYPLFERLRASAPEFAEVTAFQASPTLRVWQCWRDYEISAANAKRYQTLAEFSRATGQEAHGVELDYDIFEDVRPPDPAQPHAVYARDLDFRLRPGSKAVDAGVRLPNVNDGFAGRQPDLGAYEAGLPLPVYGPRAGNRPRPF